MATNFDIPPCANNLESTGICARSDTFVSRETNEVFVITCRTCRGVNVWPKSKDENKGRYEAKLKLDADRNRLEEEIRRKREYSYKGR